MPASDRYTGASIGPGGPYSSGFAITPADGAELERVTSAIHVGSAGALHVLLEDGTELTLAAMPVGIHRLRIRKVFATSTVASSLVGLV
jgi:hypothetical protein